jgi:NADH:ubiquinone oxidoreductase subunit K
MIGLTHYLVVSALLFGIGTLGVLALLYLAVGFWCGRFADRPEASTIGLPLVLIVAGAAFVQVGYALFQLLLYLNARTVTEGWDVYLALRAAAEER